MDLLLWILTFIGHLGSWCVVYNRTHATSWPRKVRKRCEKAVIVAVLFPLLWFVGRMLLEGSFSFERFSSTRSLQWLYLFFSACMGAFFLCRWLWRKLTATPPALRAQSQRRIDVQQELGRDLYLTKLAQALKKIPFNESHLIAVDSFELELDRLPPALDGLKICHLSDFHLTGQIDVAFFERVVAEANRFNPDLTVITGDLLDEHDCLDWIAPVFGRLQAKYGVYFVRGNHDLRILDQQALLDRLLASGMKWAGGGQWQSLDINGCRVSIAGNELPWHGGAESLGVKSVAGDDLRILLTHSPDQIRWAGPFDFDLILAGHTHGGQIALPVVGPIVAPSKYGVLYAAGTFEIENALMHVSRGLSGDECIRINCPPEVALITLRRSE